MQILRFFWLRIDKLLTWIYIKYLIFKHIHTNKMGDSDGKGKLGELLDLISDGIKDICLFIGSEPDDRAISALKYGLITYGLIEHFRELPDGLYELIRSEYLVSILFIMYFLIYGVALTNKRYIKFRKTKSAQIWADVELGKLDRIKYHNDPTTIQWEIEHLKSTINKLEDNREFPPNLQKKFLANKTIYDNIETSKLIKDTLIEKDYWHASAIVVFLKSNNEQNLSNDYLRELLAKYGDSPSVRFTVGRFCNLSNIGGIYRDDNNKKFKNPVYTGDIKFDKFALMGIKFEEIPIHQMFQWIAIADIFLIITSGLKLITSGPSFFYWLVFINSLIIFYSFNYIYKRTHNYFVMKQFDEEDNIIEGPELKDFIDEI